MNKRTEKKTQKERGYVSVGAWVRPELKNSLEVVATKNSRSVSAEMVLAIEAHVAQHVTA